jgi:uncharacterized repeat protein (TIGR03847 family)
MAKTELELKPVDHITTDAIGKPGERVFYLQAVKSEQVVTLVIEKLQVQSLAIGAEQFLAEISQKFPNLTEVPIEPHEEEMHIQPPVDPLFRVGEFGLGYDSDEDMIILLAREVLVEGQETENASVVRFWCTRMQLRALCRWGSEVVNRGRPICPQCGEPMESEGHFCPKKNGRKH